MSDQEPGLPPGSDQTGRSARLEALPSPDTRRWVARRKAQIIAAVRDDLLTFDEACRRYNISAEEFLSWERAIERHGPAALRVTRLQDFRQG